MVENKFELVKRDKLSFFSLFGTFIFLVGFVIISYSLIDGFFEKPLLFIIIVGLFLLVWIANFKKMILFFHGKEIVSINDTHVSYELIFHFLKKAYKIKIKSIKKIFLKILAKSPFITHSA